MSKVYEAELERTQPQPDPTLEAIRDAGFGLKPTDLADVPENERKELDDYLLAHAKEKLGEEPTPQEVISQRIASAQREVADIADDLGMAAAPPDHPETRALRHLLMLAMLGNHQTVRACEELHSAQILERFDHEAREAYDSARILLREIGKFYGMDYVPPRLPQPQVQRVTAE